MDSGNAAGSWRGSSQDVEPTSSHEECLIRILTTLPRAVWLKLIPSRCGNIGSPVNSLATQFSCRGQMDSDLETTATRTAFALSVGKATWEAKNDRLRLQNICRQHMQYTKVMCTRICSETASQLSVLSVQISKRSCIAAYYIADQTLRR
ncbi:hypothetical protein K437DRAFT_190439 [Tilletiaria anomala UBC 951]|uniref:Uncharacterized protein n=1 Tax=Tilletiaria anomala (strain ATCC 24038 / CBS 436.72 / UBC 951) TaxID=1037660 RepID=A0A066VP91_TILAU|nr:uncharacterized protein K437DRAFT_190439 [Tilletiaria anomala UBC 951]KDN40355.1 hypothetical protein K437DRAFT_190439 [Tilletiaria anomala UBC 951]